MGNKLSFFLSGAFFPLLWVFLHLEVSLSFCFSDMYITRHIHLRDIWEKKTVGVANLTRFLSWFVGWLCFGSYHPHPCPFLLHGKLNEPHTRHKTKWSHNSIRQTFGRPSPWGWSWGKHWGKLRLQLAMAWMALTTQAGDGRMGPYSGRKQW